MIFVIAGLWSWPVRKSLPGNALRAHAIEDHSSTNSSKICRTNARRLKRVLAPLLESGGNGDPHQLGHAAYTGLGHEVGAVNLDRSGADAKIVRDYLVDLAGQ